MPETVHGDWVVAIASIIAAIVGGIVIFLFERLRAARRSLRFVIQPTEHISDELRKHGDFIELKVNGSSVAERNMTQITVKNASNVPLENIFFDLLYPGDNPVTLADRITTNDKLREAIKIDFDPNAPSLDRRLTFSLPFFNRGETFDIKAFFSNRATSPRIECRLPDVGVTIETPEELQAKQTLKERILIAIGIIVLIVIIALLFFGIIRDTRRELFIFAPDGSTLVCVLPHPGSSLDQKFCVPLKEQPQKK